MSSTAEKRAIKRSRIYLREDVAKHNKPKDCWVIHNNKIYDVRLSIGPPPTSCSRLTRGGAHPSPGDRTSRCRCLSFSTTTRAAMT